jgi:UDP-N-acetylmuramate dehydrogenase
MMAVTTDSPLRGTLRQHEPMARHTTWRVGGPAQRFYIPADLTDLAAFLAQQPSGEPLIWLGLGSNLLVRDGGIKGTVISTGNALRELSLESPTEVRAEAGVPCAKVARFCGQNNLLGAEFLAGIPGTMGGALAMNAGAFGGETWQLVSSVETIDARGRIRVRPATDFAVSYRHVAMPEGEWFVAARLQLTAGDGAQALARIKQLLERRNTTQPMGRPTCGSVFRNPQQDHAARLIEACGLKGYCLGGACVSEKHANFIVNQASATARDIEQLIDHVRDVVRQQQGVELVPEVHVIGEPLEESGDA